MTRNKIAIALIGFGEVGQRFSDGFLRSGKATITAYDPSFHDPLAGEERILGLRAQDVVPASSAAAACRDARIVISAVTTTAAEIVAMEARHYLSPGQIFFDVNSVAPSCRQRAAEQVQAAGAHYVEGAAMASVALHGVRVPILVAGPAAAETAALLNELGMNLTPVGLEYGKASTMKLCRSIIVKGLEALIMDCTAAARIADVESEVFASLSETYPSIDWPQLAADMAARVTKHGKRRAEEMHAAASMLADMELNPSLVQAIADAQARGAKNA